LKVSPNVLENEPNYISAETEADADNKKYYFTNLYLPKTCAPYMKDGRHRI